MSKMERSQCPFSQSECVTYTCMLYDQRLDNCLVSVLAYNLYRLDLTLKRSIETQEPQQPGSFPFPRQ